jgi:hypothetical protein
MLTTTTNGGLSPYTVVISGGQQFYRLNYLRGQFGKWPGPLIRGPGHAGNCDKTVPLIHWTARKY